MIISIYRPPNTQLQIFNKEMKTIFEKIKAENKYVCIMGDYNVNTYKDEHTICSHKMDMQNLFTYLQEL